MKNKLNELDVDFIGGQEKMTKEEENPYPRDFHYDNVILNEQAFKTQTYVL